MAETPEISVAVTTRNRSDRLAGLLRSLAEQTIEPARFEVTVVDDGSTDGTRDLLAAQAGAGGLEVRALPGPGGGLAAARNASWRAARGPLVAFTDDDCEAAPDWLEQALVAAAQNPGAILQGPTTPIPEEVERTGPFTRTKRIESQGVSYQTCNIVYPRDVLERLDGFDERLLDQGEDTDLGWRARELGVELVWCERVRVHHAVDDLGPVGYLRTALRGTDSVLVFDRHPRLRAEGLRWRVVRDPGVPGLALTLAGLALARRYPPLGALLALPYARHLASVCRRQRAPLLLAPYYAFRDVLAAYTALRGSLRHGTLVL